MTSAVRKIIRQRILVSPCLATSCEAEIKFVLTLYINRHRAFAHRFIRFYLDADVSFWSKLYFIWNIIDG
jgi:hypothetical protein